MSKQRLILIPIDLHSINRRSLELLVQVARRLDRGLLALMLEDLRLQQVADLPFTTEITLSGARERSLLRDHLSVRHNRVIGSACRLLNEIAQRNRVELSFEETAGQRLHCALERDNGLDIFFPPRHQWLQQGSATGSGQLFVNRLGLLLTPGEQGQRVLDAAQILLHSGHVGDIYLLSDKEPTQEQKRTLSRAGHRLSVQTGFRCDPGALAMLLRRSPYDLLLLPRNCLDQMADDALDNALETSGGQTLLIS